VKKGGRDKLTGGTSRNPTFRGVWTREMKKRQNGKRIQEIRGMRLPFGSEDGGTKSLGGRKEGTVIGAHN